MHYRHFKLQTFDFEILQKSDNRGEQEWNEAHGNRSFATPKIGHSSKFSTPTLFVPWRPSKTVKTECEELQFPWRETKTPKLVRIKGDSSTKSEATREIPNESKEIKPIGRRAVGWKTREQTQSRENTQNGKMFSRWWAERDEGGNEEKGGGGRTKKKNQNEIKARIKQKDEGRYGPWFHVANTTKGVNDKKFSPWRSCKHEKEKKGEQGEWANKKQPKRDKNSHEPERWGIIWTMRPRRKCTKRNKWWNVFSGAVMHTNGGKGKREKKRCEGSK